MNLVAAKTPFLLLALSKINKSKHGDGTVVDHDNWWKK